MRATRTIVAFQEVESPQAKMMRHLIDGDFDDDDLVGPDRPRPKGRYWCAADRPRTGDDFRVVPVYRTHEVSEDAECQECGIGIRELQEMMSVPTEGKASDA